MKFSSLLPDAEYADNKYKAIEKEGQLIFVNEMKRRNISSVTKWMEAFHIYVAVYSEKHPQEIGNLMTYAQTIQKMADTCGDSAALNYDEKFRRWREKDPAACPWHKKNVDLYQEAVVMGMDFKLRNKKQPFRGQTKHKYCYSYNNHGSCSNGNACPHPHVCQYCAGKYPRKFCSKPKNNASKHPFKSSGPIKPTSSFKKQEGNKHAD